MRQTQFFGEQVENPVILLGKVKRKFQMFAADVQSVHMALSGHESVIGCMRYAHLRQNGVFEFFQTQSLLGRHMNKLFGIHRHVSQ